MDSEHTTAFINPSFEEEAAVRSTPHRMVMARVAASVLALSFIAGCEKSEAEPVAEESSPAIVDETFNPGSEPSDADPSPSVTIAPDPNPTPTETAVIADAPEMLKYINEDWETFALRSPQEKAAYGNYLLEKYDLTLPYELPPDALDADFIGILDNFNYQIGTALPVIFENGTPEEAHKYIESFVTPLNPGDDLTKGEVASWLWSIHNIIVVNPDDVGPLQRVGKSRQKFFVRDEKIDWSEQEQFIILPTTENEPDEDPRAFYGFWRMKFNFYDTENGRAQVFTGVRFF